MKLPLPPAEVPANRSPSVLAPKFRDAMQRVFARLRAEGEDPTFDETLRTNERERFLHGFGRIYDDADPRGIVTNATDATNSWHGYALACDVISIAHGWDRAAFFDKLGAAANAEGLAWGGDWHRPDRPHVQWGKPMLASPSENAVKLKALGGNAAVWKVVGAV